MKLPIVWTHELVKKLGGSLVDAHGEICVLCWDQTDSPIGQSRIWLLSSRDGMLYTYGDTYAEAAEKLNANGVLLYHQVACVSITGSLL